MISLKRYLQIQKKEIEKYKWVESERRGYDLKEYAIFNWMQEYSKTFRDQCEEKYGIIVSKNSKYNILFLDLNCLISQNSTNLNSQAADNLNHLLKNIDAEVVINSCPFNMNLHEIKNELKNFNINRFSIISKTPSTPPSITRYQKILDFLKGNSKVIQNWIILTENPSCYPSLKNVFEINFNTPTNNQIIQNLKAIIQEEEAPAPEELKIQY